MKNPSASTITIATSIFVVFLILRFPFQNLKGMIFAKIHKASGIYILADELYPSLFGWPGIGMKNVSVTIPIGASEIDLECAKMVVRIGLAGLFPPTPSVSLSLKTLKQGGNLYLRFARNAKKTSGAIEMTKLNLSQLSSSGSPSIAKGIADVEISFSSDHTNAALTTGEAEIDIVDFTLAAQNIQGIPLSEMKLGKVSGRMAAKNGIAGIDSFQIGKPGSDVQGSLAGEVRLDPDWNNSLMSLSLKLSLSESYVKHPDSATVTSFLNTFKVADNSYSVRLNATVAQFNQSSILLLQKGG